MATNEEDKSGGNEGTATEEKSSSRACAETTLDALAVVGRGVMATGSGILTVMQYTAYPIKEGVLCVMDTTGEYFSPYLKKQAATNVPTFRYG
ncbi:unnamed protein product [Effrenium voratum]|nr:unnamed protein product [Effrenium voratum]CAJ1429435.1 unnamed protein product [Effrenium voratum]|mmetsp:Transcript_7903/g.18921  ORF Transcript_7903/g.18921 Transcript_7903/m.18921 type:complete len:93 (+) Transcript_7903:52-330(+)